MGRRVIRSLSPGVLAAFALGFAGSPQDAHADVVRMKNGDVITGKIERADEEELVIDPKFSDAIEIELKYVATIETKRPVKVTFKDGRERTGFIELDKDGRMQVRMEPSRWEEAHGEPIGPFRAASPQPPAGTREPLDDLRTIQELEIAYYRYEANLELGISAASGNTDSSALDLSTSIEPSWGPNAVELEAKVSRQASNGALSAKNWNAGLKYERDLPNKWVASVFASTESDPFQDLDLRIAVAAVPGYRFFDVDPTHLAVGLGLAYVNENFSVAGADRTFPAVVWTFDLEREFFSEDLTLYHDHRLIQSLTGGELLLKTTQGIEIDLFGNLDLKLEFDYDHQSRPPPGITGKDDLRYMVKFDLEIEGDETDWLH